MNARGVSLRRIEGRDDAAPRCEVCLDGRATGHEVEGAVLEAALAVGDEHLVFATHDVPYEESLSIHLLDANGAPLDSITLGHAYSSGHFRLVAHEAPGLVRFRFFGDTEWTVRVLDHEGWRLPWGGDPPGVQRALGFKRRLVVGGSPQPERR